MDTPMVSIIIPTLNEEKLLPHLFDCLDKQTFQNFEVIIADAKSTDKTRDLSVERGARIVEGGLPGPGRNAGAKAALGSILIFFDADITIKPDFLDKALAEFNKRNLDVTSCRILPDSQSPLDLLMFQSSNLAMVIAGFLNKGHGTGAFMMIKTEVFNKIEGFDEALYMREDHDLLTRANKVGTFGILLSVFITTSVRRLDKEGRLGLTLKYMFTEITAVFGIKFTSDILNYEFGNYDNEKDNKFAIKVEELFKKFQEELVKEREIPLLENSEISQRTKAITKKFTEDIKSIFDNKDQL